MSNEVRLIDTNALDFDNMDFDTYDDYLFIFNLIEEAPTIEAEPMRHGHWIPRSNGYFDFVQCSACGRNTAYSVPFLFCPECGAKMDGDAI